MVDRPAPLPEPPRPDHAADALAVAICQRKPGHRWRRWRRARDRATEQPLAEVGA